MTKKNEVPADESQAMVVAASANGFMALTTEGSDELREMVEENFGGKTLTLADVDKIKVPAGGGISWELSTAEGVVNVPELELIIIGWADKKGWWSVSFADSDGKSQPDCKSNDMIHGIGNPNMSFNSKEMQLIDTGKASKMARRVEIPDSDGQHGYLCATCPHNIFGSAPQGNGKACQDKRFLLCLFKDSLLPVLLRVPATSIPVIKEYFKRLMTTKSSHLRVITKLTLEKIPAAKPYSKIIARVGVRLAPEEVEAVKKFREPFMMALNADDAIEQGYVEKGSETLDDMPTHTGSTEPEGETPDVQTGNAPVPPAGNDDDVPF